MLLYSVITFNSIKVRLKLIELRLHILRLNFQFHKGAIETHSW